MQSPFLHILRRRARLAGLVILVVCGVLLLGSPGVANTPIEQAEVQIKQSTPPVQANEPSPDMSEDDDQTYEIGVEWITDYEGTANYLWIADDSCDGLYYPLVDMDDWTGKFRYGNTSAWEEDFKRNNYNYGGNENGVVDQVDLAMVCTLGTSNGWDQLYGVYLRSAYFSTEHDDFVLTPGDGYQSYGNLDLEWLIFEAGSLLDDPSRPYWAATMNGLHLLLGTSNTGYCSSPGNGYYMRFFLRGKQRLGYYLIPPHSITQSWFLTMDYSQPAGVCGRVLAEATINYIDYLWGRGAVTSDPVVDAYYSYADHCSTGETLATTNQANGNVTEALSVPLVVVEPRIVDEDYVRGIAPAFNISDTIISDGIFYYLVDGTKADSHVLMVDQTTGSFDYRNWDEMWLPPVVTPTLPSFQVALNLVEDFFSQHKGLPGAWFRNGQILLNIESINGQAKAGLWEAVNTEVISSMPMDLMITYERVIPVTITTTEGITDVILPVVGPGSNMKVYFGDGGEIIGMHGGSRDVNVMSAKVEVLPFEEAWGLFLADPSIALPELGILANEFEVITHTLGYYEMPYLVGQAELIPVWIVTADVMSGTLPQEEGVQINIPAVEQYMPPMPIITAPISGTSVEQGEVVTLEGLAEGGKPPYTLVWTSSGGGFLGEGKTLPVVLWPYWRETFGPQAITLTVTDANGQTGSTTVQVVVKPKVYLPFVTR